MKASHLLVRQIKRFEGFRKKAYQDVKGVWTIGYGHTGDVKEGDYITKQQAEELLLKDLERFERFVDSLDVCHGDQGKFDALTDFAYNCGIENLKKSTLLLYICEGRSEAEIRHEFSRWVYSGGRELRGLAKRRQWETDRFFNSNHSIFAEKWIIRTVPVYRGFLVKLLMLGIMAIALLLLL